MTIDGSGRRSPDDPLWAGLIDDASMFPPGSASPPLAVIEQVTHRGAWYADMIGPLVVADTALDAVDRAVTTTGSPGTIAVSVVISGGAGGITALARRTFDRLMVVSVEAALRDLDDLTGAAQRTVAAARALDPRTAVWVEFPRSPGWLGAVEVVEAAGLSGKIRTGGVEPDDHPTATALAEQLHGLVEADLPFKATAGLHHALPHVGRNDRGVALPRHGLLTLLLALEATIDDAPVEEVARLLGLSDPVDVAARVAGWDDAAAARLRRRFRSFGCCDVLEPIEDLIALGLLEAGDPNDIDKGFSGF